MRPQKVIFDTDPGVDDALALLYLHRHPAIELVGITTVFGNAPIEVTTRNARFLAREWGIVAPVHPGAAAPIDPSVGKTSFPKHIHGENGLGSYPIPEQATPVIDTAAAFLIDTIRDHPGEIRILAVGPLTNLALALQQAPEIAGLVRDVVVMGGAFDVPGNTTPAAEANIFADPVAADIVFGADWAVTAVPLNVTRQTVLTRETLARLATTGGHAMRMVAEISQGYIDYYRESGREGMLVHDCCAAVYLTNPDLFVRRSGPVRVAVGGNASGQTEQRPDGLVVPARDWEGRPSQSVCRDGDAGEILSCIHRTCGAETTSLPRA